MQAQNTLFYSVSMQRNKNALFVSFSFAAPLQTTVPQRSAHYVATLHSKLSTSAQVDAIVRAQQQRDKAAAVSACNTKNIDKLLFKNDERAALMM